MSYEEEEGYTSLSPDLRTLILELSRALLVDVDEGAGVDRLFNTRDEDQLTKPVFERTFSGTGYEGVDRDGQSWRVYADRAGGQGGMLWYKVKGSGATERIGNMTYNRFKELFCYV